MSFSSEWLALREPADIAARSPGLVYALGQLFPGRAPHIVDLGAGTGATWRALSPVLPNARWTLVDHDAALLAEAQRRTGAQVRRADLASGVRDLIADADIVTASALFDLAGAEWTAGLLEALPRGAAFYAALTYDGREVWSPADPLEQTALAAFHADQRRDKGLGPAMGPDAVRGLTAMLDAWGWPYSTAQSDWRLGHAHRPLIRALADGAAVAAAQSGSMTSEQIEAWRGARRRGKLVTIGHTDILAARSV